MDASIIRAYRFFRENAGYIVGRSAEGALDLARAEALLQAAVDLGVASVEWLDDEEPFQQDICTAEEAREKFESNEWTGPFGCVVQVGDEIASLWGIVVGQANLNDPYCRVVAAELAYELRDDLQQAVGDARDRARHPSGICHFPV